MKTCLVVDDSRVIRKLVRKIIEDFGFAVDEAEDGQQALDACTKTMPQLVMLDWNMPVMNGMEFLRALRQKGGDDQPVVIVCTTENDMSRIEEAIMTGANEYVMKPFDSDIIRGKLEQVGLYEDTGL